MRRVPPSVEALAGLLLGFLAAAPGAPGVGLVASAAAAALLLPSARRARVVALAAALGLASAARWEVRPRADDLSAALGDAPVRALLEGTVRESDPPAPEASTFLLDAEAWTGDGGRRTGRAGVRVRVEGPPEAMPPVHAGDRVVVAGRLARIAGPTNPGVFDAAAAAARRGVHARLDVPDPRGVERVRPSDGPLAGISRLRHAAAAALDGSFPAADAGLLRSLLLGDRGALGEDDRERFRRAGAAHVLAISGAHVALLVGGLLHLLRHARVAPRPAAGIVLLVVLGFVPLTGSAPPVVRSAAGFALFLLGRVAGREPSGGAILATVALGFLVLDPSASEDPGFRMSFAAAGGLVLLAGRLRAALVPPRAVRLPGDRERPRALLRSALAAGTAAWLASTPVAVHDLGQAGLVAVPVGVVVVPLSTVAILCGAGALLAGAVPGLGHALRAATEVVLAVTRAALDVPSLLGTTQEAVARPDAVWYAAYLAAFLALSRARPALAVAGAWTLAVLLAALSDDAPAGPPPGVRLTLLDVGHGQAALLETPDGQRALLDAGSRDRPGIGARVVLPALRALGATSLDVAVASHADADHAGALPEVLAGVPTRVVVVPPRFPAATLARVAAETESRLVARDGDVLLQGPWGRLVVRGPARRPPDGTSRNDGCLVVAVETPEGAILLPGDREAAGVADLLAAHPDLAADVLVLPHHGHAGPGRERLLAAVGARVLLASAPRAMDAALPAATASTGSRGALVVDVRTDRTDLRSPWKASPADPRGYLPPPSRAPPMADLQTLAVAAAVLTVVALVAARLRWLTAWGAVGAAVLGLLAIHAFGWPGLAALLAPFLAGTLSGRLPGGTEAAQPRSLRQVAANGLPAVVGVLLAAFGAPARGARAFAGALSALGADTLATEVGTRWGGTPRHAVTLRPLARGESGGITLAGILGSVAGGALAPAAFAAAGAVPANALPGLTAAGVGAAYADSVLGALVQRKGRCSVCGRVVETPTCCGRAPERLRGRLPWLDNDVVNLASGLVGAALAVLLA